MRMSTKEYDDYMRKNFPDRVADTVANLEQVVGNEPLGKKKGARFDTPCRVHFHSVRARLADSDGISGKAAIDGIVHAGILSNDSPKEICEVTHSQELGDIEKTIIQITQI